MSEQQSSLNALSHRSLNESLKLNIFNTIKQIKTVSEFINKVCLIKEHAATQLLTTIESFKRRGNDFKKDNRSTLGSVSNTWEALLIDTEDEARELLQLSQKLVNSICVPLMDQTAKKKAVLKKIFMNRETLESQLDKTEEMLTKSYKDYSDSWSKYKLYNKDPQKEQHVSTICYNSHNNYVSQVAGFNRQNEILYKNIIPEMLTDAQTTLNELGKSYSSLMQQCSLAQNEKLNRRMEKLQTLEQLFGYVDVNQDLCQYVQSLGAGEVKIPRKSHENPEVDSSADDVLGESLLLNPLTEPGLKRKYYYMNSKVSDIVNIIDKDKTALNALKHLRNSYAENPSYGNADVMTEDIVKSDFEVKQKKIHFAVLSAQMSLFTREMIEDMGPMEGLGDSDGDGDIYTRMFDIDKQPHKFVNYISKRPMLCAYCKGVTIGIVKPTVRCKVCKLMVHSKCKINVAYCTGTLPDKSGGKSPASRTASMDSRMTDEDDDDNHLYSAIVDEIDDKPTPKTRFRRHSGSAVEGRAVFVNGSYGSSPNLVPSPPEVPGKPALKKKPEQCVVLYDYESASKGDLAVKAGQKITLLNSSQGDWWEGSFRGKTGFFPASYVLKLKDKDVILKCLFDFDGEEEDELSIAVGQILVLVEDEGNGWMVGRTADGEGIFPSTYVSTA